MAAIGRSFGREGVGMPRLGWTMRIAGLAVAAWLSGAGMASATMPIQKKARELGLAAQTCLACHNEKLPKKGAVTHNERGQWLVDQKEKRKAKEVDPAWLKDYVEKKP
jgi:mono/diheme cytochrome c family protein